MTLFDWTRGLEIWMDPPIPCNYDSKNVILDASAPCLRLVEMYSHLRHAPLVLLCDFSITTIIPDPLAAYHRLVCSYVRIARHLSYL